MKTYSISFIFGHEVLFDLFIDCLDQSDGAFYRIIIMTYNDIIYKKNQQILFLIQPLRIKKCNQVRIIFIKNAWYEEVFF